MVHFILYAIPAIVTLIGIRKWRERSWGYCLNKIQLAKKVVIVTGANSGIGYEIVKELACRKAQVILACRNTQLAQAAITKIKNQIQHEVDLVAMELDLSSLESVRKFARNFQERYSQLDILINNAGVAYPKNQLHFTKDNVEVHFGVNHLGHFHLTNLLLSTILQSPSGRVITVSSILHQKGEINFEPDPSRNLYADSKLANIYFSHELARRLHGTNVGVFAVCPGWVFSSLFRHSVRWYHYILVSPIAFLFMRSPKQGAQSIIYCATEPNLQTGSLIRDCRYFKSEVNFDKDVALKLWEHSEGLIEMKIKK